MSKQSDLVSVSQGADGDPLYIDSTNNRVGIGTSSPSATLNVEGIIRASHASGDRINLNHDGVNGSLTNVGGDFLLYANGAQAMIAHTNGTERMRIDSSGNLLVGKTAISTSTVGFEARPIGFFAATRDGAVIGILDRKTSDGTILEFRKDGSTVGSISVTGSSTSYNTSSDHRLKENLVDLTGATTRLKQLEPKRFNFIADADTTVDGFLAHEVQTVVPEAITGTHNEVDADGNPVYQGIDQSKLVPLLTAALQEAIAKIETLETEMTSVKSRLDALEAE